MPVKPLNVSPARFERLHDWLDDRFYDWSLRQVFSGLMVVIGLVTVVTGMMFLTRSSGWAMESNQAMVDDPALPFRAWNRVIAEAPSREARLVLTQAREDTVAHFEAPFWHAYLFPNSFSELLDAGRMMRMPPVQLFQRLGGLPAYREAVLAAQSQALDRDAQANLDSGRVRRGEILGTTLPALLTAAH